MRNSIIFRIAVPLALSFFFWGCEAFSPKPLQLADMVPRNPELVYPSSGKTCSLGLFEGRKEKGELIYKVTTVEMKKVVTDGLKHSQLFTTVYSTEQKDTDYTLTAKILGEPLDMGASGMSSTIALYVNYKLIRNTSGEVVFNKRIQSVHTESLDSTRVRKSYEGAVRENVKKLLQEISVIKL